MMAATRQPTDRRSSEAEGAVLHIHRADRSDALVAALAEVLAEPLPDPMAFDVVAVPARGIERWITQQLSHRLGRTDTEAGVCAGVRFPSPAGLIAEIVGGRDGRSLDSRPAGLAGAERDRRVPDRAVGGHSGPVPRGGRCGDDPWPDGRPGPGRSSLRGGASGGRAVRPVRDQSAGHDR